MKIQENMILFLETGREFEKKHLYGFLQKKPKKVLTHTKQTLRFYRDKDLGTFRGLTGTILIWRYLMHSNIPQREKNKIEQSILRTFNFILNQVTSGQIEKVRYLLQETTPARSFISPGNPLRSLIELKLIEFDICSSDHSRDKTDKLALAWREQYSDLTNRFRFRIPFSSV